MDDSFDVLGICYNTKKMGKITERNISMKMKDIKNLISVWRTIQLTPYEKAVLIKRLIIQDHSHPPVSTSPNSQTFSVLKRSC